MGSDVGRVIFAEWLKLRRRRTTVAIPALVGLFTVVVYFGVDFVARRQWVGLPSGFYVAAESMDWATNLVVFLAVVATSFHVSREFALGTVKSAWVRPLTRGAWFAGKVLSAWGVVTALFLFAAIIAIMLSAIRFGFADLMEKDFLIHSAGSLGWRLVVTLALTLWSLWAVVAVTSLVGGLINHPGGTIAVALGLGMVLTVLALFAPLRPFLLSTYLSLPTECMVAMTKGLAMPYSWGQVIWRTLAGAGVWMAAALFAGYVVIKRKEITF